MKSSLRALAVLAFVLVTVSIQAAADGLPVPTCDPFVTKNCKMPGNPNVFVR